MDGSFSISLKKKNNKKKRLNNVFQTDDDTVKESLSVKKQRVRVTHIENVELNPEEKKKEKELVIKIPSDVDKGKDDESSKNENNGNNDDKSRFSKQTIPSLEEYNEIPVELFGDAMLRGMGWNGMSDDDKGDDNKTSKLDPNNFIHPDNLGIGANESSLTESKEPFMPIRKILKKE